MRAALTALTLTVDNGPFGPVRRRTNQRTIAEVAQLTRELQRLLALYEQLESGRELAAEAEDHRPAADLGRVLIQATGHFMRGRALIRRGRWPTRSPAFVGVVPEGLAAMLELFAALSESAFRRLRIDVRIDDEALGAVPGAPCVLTAFGPATRRGALLLEEVEHSLIGRTRLSELSPHAAWQAATLADLARAWRGRASIEQARWARRFWRLHLALPLAEAPERQWATRVVRGPRRAPASRSLWPDLCLG